MDSLKAFEALSQVALPKPDWSYVPIVAAALRSKASFLRIALDQNGCTFDYDGEPLFDSENLLAIALKANNSRPERHLGSGLVGLSQMDATWVSYEHWDGNSGSRLKLEGGKPKFERLSKAPWKESEVRHRVRLQSKKARKGLGGLFGGNKLEELPPEAKVVQDLCRFAPIPIEINGTVISKPVDMGRSLVCLVFDPPNPGFVRLKLGEQDTLDQTTIPSGEPYSAIVAVGGSNPQLTTLNLVVDGLLVKVDDPKLSAMGIRCVITCPDLQVGEGGQILQDEAYQRVVADLTRQSLMIGEMLAEKLADMQSLDHVEAADYVKYYADLHESHGDYIEAEALLVKLLEAQEDTLGDDDVELAGTLLKIAALRWQLKQLEGARQCYQRTLDLYQELRPDQPIIAQCHAGLAVIEFSEMHLEEAEQDAQLALDLRKAHLDPNDLQLGVSHEMLARIFRHRYQYPQRKFLEIDNLYLQAIRIFEKNLGTNHLEVANLVHDLAEHRRQQRRYREAEPLYKRALTLRQEHLGPEAALVAATLESLGGLYEEQGRASSAGESYSRALTIREALLGPEHEEVVERITNLVRLYRLYGKFDQAEPLYQRILAIHSRGSHSNPAEVARGHSNLALLHAAQGKWPQAAQGLSQAHQLLQSVSDSQSEQAWTLDQLGAVLIQQAQYDEAQICLVQAQVIWQKVLGPEHCDLCLNLELQARLSLRQGQWTQAEAHLRTALALKEATLGKWHRETVSTLGSLAEVLRGADREEESRSLHQEVILRRERAATQVGTSPEEPKHEPGPYGLAKQEAQSLAQQAAAPARIYKRYQEAEHLYLKALLAVEQTLGPSHPDITFALDDLVELYKKHRKFEAAQELCQRTLALRKQALGIYHPDLSLSLMAHIDILMTQKRSSAAEPLTREWLNVVGTTVGDNHPEYAKVLELQAKIYGEAGALEKQEECNRKALELRRQALGTEHPDFATSLADLLCLQKKYEEAGRLYSFVVNSLEESLGSESPELIPVYEKYAGVLRKLNREALAVELETQAMVMRVQHGLDFGEN